MQTCGAAVSLHQYAPIARLELSGFNADHHRERISACRRVPFWRGRNPAARDDQAFNDA
jgi:hypothetical protein